MSCERVAVAPGLIDLGRIDRTEPSAGARAALLLHRLSVERVVSMLGATALALANLVRLHARCSMHCSCQPNPPRNRRVSSEHHDTPIIPLENCGLLL